MILYEHYFERLESIQVQFAFARTAIRGFIESNDPSVQMPEQPDPFVPLSALAGKDETAEWVKGIVNYLEVLKGGFPDKHKDLENMLAQNEVILIVAVFEDQMKAIHREVLRQNPSLLNPDREIKLGKLVAFKEQKVIEAEIENAIRVLDRKSVKDRAKEFERLGLPWRRERIERVDEITTLRNRILHEDIEILVSGSDLATARSISVLLPLQLYMEAEVVYPSGFNSGHGLEERQKLAERARAVLDEQPKP